MPGQGLIERISSEIDKQVDVGLAQRGIQPSRAAGANVAMGLGSVGLGIAAAVTLHSLSNTGTAPNATVDRSIDASMSTTTPTNSMVQVVGIVLIGVVIAVVKHRLRPPSSKSFLGHQGPDSPMLVMEEPGVVHPLDAN